MTRAIVNGHAAGLPGATQSDPWGGRHDAWKVGESCLPWSGPARRWVRFPWGLVDEAELRARISLSYAIIRASLPKTVQAAFGG